jgi:xanthine dehydrogenase YagR molybdenum-binding subunit
MTQIAADVLGVPVTDVVFRLGDTRFPETPVSGGSQTAATCGTAVFEAAQALRERIRSAGREGESPRETVARSGQPYLEGKASVGANEDAKKFSSYSFGAQFAEVHVDADVGQIYVARMTGVFAAGTILNAKTARSQFIGGMVWGISLALHEESIYDRHLGRIVNNNLAEYHVPVNADVGEIDATWVKEDDLHVSAMGAKGIGEIGITGSAAAVANAIYHATGKRIRQTPITPEQLI